LIGILFSFLFETNKSITTHNRLSKSGTIWSAAKSGTIEDFDNAVKKGQNVNETGESFCETVLHVACLYSNTPVALHIAQKYPDLILKQQIGIHEGIISHFTPFKKNERFQCLKL